MRSCRLKTAWRRRTDRVQNRQRELAHNKMTLEELQSLSPALNWSSAMQGLGMFTDEYIIRQPSFFEEFPASGLEVSLAQSETLHAI